MSKFERQIPAHLTTPKTVDTMNATHALLRSVDPTLGCTLTESTGSDHEIFENAKAKVGRGYFVTNFYKSDSFFAQVAKLVVYLMYATSKASTICNSKKVENISRKGHF